MHFPEKRKHVMLAQAEEFDVPHDDHFIVFDVEQGAVHDGADVLGVAFGEKFESAFPPDPGV